MQAPGSRPHLRRLRASDADAVCSAFASCPEMVRQGNVTDAASAARYVAALVNDDDCADAAGVDQTGDDSADSTADACDDKDAFAVVDENDRLWGLVCINRDAANRVGWFWYWMHAATRKRGWTSQAAATVANWALRDGGYERLDWGIALITLAQRASQPRQVSCRRASSGRSSLLKVSASMFM